MVYITGFEVQERATATIAEPTREIEETLQDIGRLGTIRLIGMATKGIVNVCGGTENVLEMNPVLRINETETGEGAASAGKDENGQ